MRSFIGDLVNLSRCLHFTHHFSISTALNDAFSASELHLVIITVSTEAVSLDGYHGAAKLRTVLRVDAANLTFIVNVAHRTGKIVLLRINLK